MYDYQKDPQETENMLNKPLYQQEQIQLEELFSEHMRLEYRKYQSYAKIADFHPPIPTKGESQ
jgi:hypothetical protein